MKTATQFLDPAENLKSKVAHTKKILYVEILLTVLFLFVGCFYNVSKFFNDIDNSTTEVSREYKTTIDHYLKMYDSIFVPVQDKISEDPSFDELQTWLHKMDPLWGAALGTDFFDGLALTYKGGYAHSWSYGDYSNYDATTRPWYKQAQESDGEPTIIAPYVTYLNPEQLADPTSAITMSIAQKYSSSITFDLDIKIKALHDIVKYRNFGYDNSKMLLYDKFGNVLASTEDVFLSHNVYRPDTVITEDMAREQREGTVEKSKIELNYFDNEFKILSTTKDPYKNTILLSMPLTTVIVHDYLSLFIFTILLLVAEIYVYKNSLKNIYEFYYKDKRLSALADATYNDRLYIDIESMRFYGSAPQFKGLVAPDSYYEIYDFVQSRLCDKDKLEEFAAFLAPENLANTTKDLIMEKKRFDLYVSANPDSDAKSDSPEDLVKRTFDVSKITFVNNKRVTVSLATQDVSDSVQTLKAALKQAKISSSAKSSFLSKMSHEIRTPLNAIIGYMNLAADEKIGNPKIEHYLANSEVAAKHLLQIINDVLDISAIENGKMKVANEEFNLKDVVLGISSILNQNAAQKDISFKLTMEDVTEEWLIGDKLRLNQILMNLLSNSLKFTPAKGMVSLHIKKLQDTDTNVFLQFVVTDTGIGMSQEFISRVFNAFEQESATTAQKYGGSGLGLSISHNLVLLMGGTIDVRSRENKGSSFTVTLPFGKSENHADDLSKHIQFSKIRALIVDDDVDEAKYIKTVAKHCGIKADVVTSGKEAITKLTNRLDTNFKYNICIMDWNMPEMNGIELASALHKICKDDLPMVIATAYDANQIIDDAHKVGVSKVISKPVFQSSLMDILVSTFGPYDTPELEANADNFTSLKGINILLAEDNPMNMEIACALLKKVGVNVVSVVNGFEAYETFVSSKEKEFDAILMDVQMPILDGYQASKKIRNSRHPEAATIPIIALTANAFTEDVNSALAAGMNAHIAKPIDVKKLYTTLSKYLKKVSS